MKFTYEDLLSGESLYVEGVGHIRSPFLRELKPTTGIGTYTYNLYLNILSWDKNSYLKFITASKGRELKALNDERLQAFDVVILIEPIRELLQNAMAFFIDEQLRWDGKNYKFEAYSKIEDKVIGYIDRNNFEEVRDMMLQVNYIGIGDEAKPTKFTSQKAKELWERAQQKMKEINAKKAPDKRMELANIISKLCAASCGYTLLNIYDLTIFQLYDQFFQYGYLRAMDLNERAYTIHGGKEFKFETWLNPILQL